MCRVLGVSPSGYYAWRDREPSARAKEDEALRVRIRAIHERSRGTYGAPRIHAELVEEGRRVSRKRVARVMREMGLAGASRRQSTRTTRREDTARAAPDLVERRFGQGFCTWRLSSTCSAAVWWVGRWPRTCEPSWCSMR